MGKQFGGDNRQQYNNKPRGGGNFRGGPGGRGRPAFDQGPPSYVIPYGVYLHKSENTFMVKCTDTTRVPKFNRGLYLENKSKVGSVDEILGPINNFYFSVKPAEGVNAASFKEGQVFYMNPQDLLPMDRFTNTSKPQGGKRPAGGRPGGFNKGGPGGFNKGGPGGFNKGGPGGFNRGGPSGFRGGSGGFNRGGFKGKR